MTTVERVLSYVSGRVVEKRPSAISGVLEVWRQNDHYVLHAQHVNYSYDTLHKVFQRAFKKTSLKSRKIKNALLLGFGAGSVATILAEELKLDISLTAVEADTEVLSLAKKYFDLQRFQQLDMHLAFAEDFVKNHSSKYDLIVHDVFVDQHVPAEVQTEAYLTNLIRLTASGGIGFYNFLVDNVDQKRERYELEKRFNKLNQKITSLNLSSVNRMLVWENEKNKH